ncbi:MAG: segregation/condensation protein A [Bacillota bacterium]|nr:segregation/condensation protein A [Bacillota bacterium]
MQNITESISYKLPVFEGPLDLLLDLIAKNKLNIYDIQIAVLLEQYMESIEEMQQADMEIESEFLEMAARLVYIKSVSLLPKYEEVEELKKELTGQLLEYQELKKAAAVLAPMASFDAYFREPAELEYDQTYNLIHKSMDILNAYTSAVGRGKRRLPPPKEAFSGIVEKKVVPVSTKIIHVLRRLVKNTKVSYRSLFADLKGKSDLVATFLALLELVKEKRVRVEGSGENMMVEVVLKNTTE